MILSGRGYAPAVFLLFVHPLTQYGKTKTEWILIPQFFATKLPNIFCRDILILAEMTRFIYVSINRRNVP